MTLLEVMVAVADLVGEGETLEAPELAVRLLEHHARELRLEESQARHWGSRLWRQVGLMGTVIVVADALGDLAGEELTALAAAVILTDDSLFLYRGEERNLALELGGQS